MEQSVKKPSRLGRGLSALMAAPVEVLAPTQEMRASAATEGVDVPRETSGRGSDSEDPSAERKADVIPKSPESQEGARVWRLPVESIRPNPHQPRQRFSSEALEELSASIRQHGVMQPVLVRALSGGEYELIAGERRWRAARLVGLETVPAVVHDLGPRESAEWAIVENLQREDLNPLERADAFQKLIEGFGLTHEQVAQQVGVDRTSVTNHLRLLRLHPDIQGWLTNNLLSMGHARALAGIDQQDRQVRLARKAVESGWSVRQLEAALRLSEPGTAPPPHAEPVAAQVKSAVIADMERQLTEALGTRVTLKTGRKKGSGVVSIEYHSLDGFDALVQRLGITLQ